jgi:ABC-type multidrug transport system, ATPase and permease components
MSIVGYCTAEIPLRLGRLVDGMMSQQIHDLAQAKPFLLTIATFYLLRELFQVIRKITVEQICSAVERDATVKVITKLLMADIATLKSEPAGALNGRIHRGVAGLVRLLKLNYLDLLPSVAGAVFALFAAVRTNACLGLVMAAIIPVGLLIVLVQLASQRGIRIDLLNSKNAIDGTVVEQLGGIESVRAAHTLDNEVGKVSMIADGLCRKEFKHHVVMTFFDAAKSINEGVFHIATITVAISFALSGSISPGDILSFSVLFISVVNPLREVHRIIDEAQESTIRAADFFTLVGLGDDLSFSVEMPQAPDLSSADIVSARNLTVSYPAKDGSAGKNAALRGVSLSIRKGEVIGLAGPSGSGKSTFVRALLRLNSAFEGDLRIGNVPINNVTRGEIGRLFGFVSQTPFLFSGTIAENIAYGCPSAALAEIAQAAHKAQIAEEIENLPGQYEYSLTERGENLSGGQRQRIALARVLLQNPAVLILDEATAALDNENERAVMETILNSAETRTIIIIAHRLSSLKRADRVLVFRRGKIVETGSYTELATLHGGVFSRLLFGRESAA